MNRKKTWRETKGSKTTYYLWNSPNLPRESSSKSKTFNWHKTFCPSLKTTNNWSIGSWPFGCWSSWSSLQARLLSRVEYGWVLSPRSSLRLLKDQSFIRFRASINQPRSLSINRTLLMWLWISPRLKAKKIKIGQFWRWGENKWSRSMMNWGQYFLYNEHWRLLVLKVSGQ